ncbi:hypothetical protein HYPSUDRAFT_59074, partial [Hypholoma sublateritium FD-334 SS-4]
ATPNAPAPTPKDKSQAIPFNPPDKLQSRYPPNIICNQKYNTSTFLLNSSQYAEEAYINTRASMRTLPSSSLRVGDLVHLVKASGTRTSTLLEELERVTHLLTGRTPCGYTRSASCPWATRYVVESDRCSFESGIIPKRDASDRTRMPLTTPTGLYLTFDILEVFPFTSESKRMGIVVRDTQRRDHIPEKGRGRRHGARQRLRAWPPPVATHTPTSHKFLSDDTMAKVIFSWCFAELYAIRTLGVFSSA